MTSTRISPAPRASGSSTWSPSNGWPSPAPMCKAPASGTWFAAAGVTPSCPPPERPERAAWSETTRRRAPLARFATSSPACSVLRVVIFVFVVDLMAVDGDTSAVAVADPGADIRGVAAVADDRHRRHLGNEDAIELGIGRHRMRPGRLRDGFDQEILLCVDDAEDGPAGLPVGPGVVAPVALVEPDLVGTGDAGNGRLLLALGVDHQGDRVARIVRRRAAQQEIVMRSDGRAVRSAGMERDDAGIGGRIEGTLDGSGLRERLGVGDQQAAVAGDRPRKLSKVATRRVVGDDRDRRIEALGLRIP